jgi:hypothetical protein
MKKNLNLLERLNSLGAEFIRMDNGYLRASIHKDIDVDPEKNKDIEYIYIEGLIDHIIEDYLYKKIESKLKNTLKGYNLNYSINLENICGSEERWHFDENGEPLYDDCYWTTSSFYLDIEIWVDLQ